MATDRIPFAFDSRYRIAGRAFGVTADSSYVELDDDRFVARFGPWTVDTPPAATSVTSACRGPTR